MKITRVPPSPAQGLPRSELIVGNTYLVAGDPDDCDVYMAIEVGGNYLKMMVNLQTGLAFSGGNFLWVPVDAEVRVK